MGGLPPLIERGVSKMIKFVLWIISSAMLLGITFAGVFGIFCLAIMIWTGCSFNEAVRKIFRWMLALK